MILNANGLRRKAGFFAGAILLPALLTGLFISPVHADSGPVIDGMIDPAYGGYQSYSPQGAFVYIYESADAVSFCLKVHPALNDNAFAPHHSHAPGWGREHWFKSLLQSDKAHVVLRDASGSKVYDFILDYLFDTGVGSLTDAARWGSGVWPQGKGWTYDGKSLKGSPLSAASSLEWNLQNEDSGFDVTNGGYAATPVETKYWVSPSPFDPAYAGNWEFAMTYEFQVDKSAFGAEGFGSIEVLKVHNSPAKGPVPVVPEVSTLVLTGFGLVGIGGFVLLRRKKGRVESQRKTA